MIAIVTQMNVGWWINHGKMGSAGYVPTGIGSSGTFKKHLLVHGIILSCINGYETSNKNATIVW